MSKIEAVESCFEGAFVYLYDFHREQAWERWVSCLKNGVASQKDEVLSRVRRLAHATTEVQYDVALKDLQESNVWLNHTKLQKWFSGKWLPEVKRWVWAYREPQCLLGIHTNNGIERQNQAFKHEYVRGCHSKTLSGMVTALVEEFLPEAYSKYVEDNLKASSCFRKYNFDIPAYLYNRPPFFVRQCLDKLSLAKDSPRSSITCQNQKRGEFLIKSQTSTGHSYKVILGGSRFPSCTCLDWKRTFMLCKHMFAVIENNFGWSWTDLPDDYTSCNLFCLDLVGLTEWSASAPNNCDVLEDKSDGDRSIDHQEDSTVTEICFTTLPARKTSPTSIASKCREKLKQLSSLTYVVNKEEELQQLERAWDQCLHNLSTACPKDCGLVIEQVNSDKQKKRRRVCSVASKLKVLRKPSRKKHPFSGRVGKQANLMSKLLYVKPKSPVMPTLSLECKKLTRRITDNVQAKSTCNTPRALLESGPSTLKKIKDLVDVLTEEEWAKFLGDAGSFSGSDMLPHNRRANAALSHLTDEEHEDLMNYMQMKTPKVTTISAAINLPFLIVSQMVRNRKILLSKYPEELDEEGRIAMQELTNSIIDLGTVKNTQKRKHVTFSPSSIARKQKKMPLTPEILSGPLPQGGLMNPVGKNLCFANSLLQALRATDIHKVLLQHRICALESVEGSRCFTCSFRRFLQEGPISAGSLCCDLQAGIGKAMRHAPYPH